MKKRFLKTYDKFLIALLGLFPFFSACDNEPRVEYGMPTADYLFNGTITDNETNTPVKNLQVTLQVPEIYEMAHDTTYTDASGKYSFDYNAISFSELTVKLKVEDIDGTVNGGPYITKEDSVTLDDSNWDKSDAEGWYQGKATVKNDFKMKK